MCGFIGSFGNSNYNNFVSNSKSIRYRGRDNESFLGFENGSLKFFRLSINDLSNEGNQPFIIDQKLIAINGEIYNHNDLRELFFAKYQNKINGTSDCKVASELISKNINNINLLEGMFAGVIFDNINTNLTLFRDNLGIKPLYYFHDEVLNQIIYASEIKGILEIIGSEINNKALLKYLIFHGLDSHETLYKKIKAVKPGEILDFSLKDERIIKKSKLLNKSNLLEKHEPIDSISLEVEDIIIHAMDRHTKMDVPYAFQLSGGLDSSLLCAIERRIFSRKPNTFSISLPEGAEMNEQKKQLFVSKFVNSNHVDISYTKKDFENDIAYTSSISDFPILHPNSVPIYRLAKIARSNFKVLLSGEGADEMFMGYNKYSYAINQNLLDLFGKVFFFNHKFIPKIWKLKSITNLLNGQSSAQDGFHSSRTINLDIFSQVDNKIRRNINFTNDLGKDIQLDDLSFSLYWLLNRYDNFTMAANVEGRVPFCDKSLLNLCKAIPSKQHLHRNEKKFILKNIALKFLPPEIVLQKKIGFSLPLQQWFSESKFLKSYLDKFLKTNLLNKINLKLNQEASDYDSELLIKKDIELTWQIFSLSIWLSER